MPKYSPDRGTRSALVKIFFVFLLLLVPFQDAYADSLLQDLKASKTLQRHLDVTVSKLRAKDLNLRAAKLRVAVIDLSDPKHPTYAHINGSMPVYPASVVKFVYLIAAYQWREDGRLTISKEFRELLAQMIGPSSNRATQKVFAELTGTTPGPELSGKAYGIFRDKRLSVKRWLSSIGIHDLHTIHPTYDGSADIFGRDAQFLGDTSVTGGLARADGTPANRQSMTALGTARLLMLLAEGKILSKEDTQEVLEYMYRDVAKQPYQAGRIAGGAARAGQAISVYSKSGTWGPIFADAGIAKYENGTHVILAIFIERAPPYRGSFIADLAAGILNRRPQAEITHSPLRIE